MQKLSGFGFRSEQKICFLWNVGPDLPLFIMNKSPFFLLIEIIFLCFESSSTAFFLKPMMIRYLYLTNIVNVIEWNNGMRSYIIANRFFSARRRGHAASKQQCLRKKMTVFLWMVNCVSHTVMRWINIQHANYTYIIYSHSHGLRRVAPLNPSPLILSVSHIHLQCDGMRSEWKAK